MRFERQRDRQGHTIEVHGALGWTPILQSVEGTDTDDWPASPPLRELAVEQRSQGSQVALLLGMAGASHWSAAVELDGTGRRVSFDLACRVQDVADHAIGSTYRLLGDACEQTPQGLMFNGLAVLACRTADTVMRLDANGTLWIGPASARMADSRTIQWCYWIEVTSRSQQ